MAVPSLVIGLGGTGQWVLTYLKKNLLETYGDVPKGVRIRSFDTVKTARARAGSDKDDRTRKEERAVAGVRLETGEYIHVGGYVKDFVREIAQDEENERYPHLRSWFQAEWYLDNLSDQQFFLDEGAGMFRQFGRLAVFYDLRAATIARLYGQLQDTVQAIQRETNAQNLQVIIVSSLAGGTGAGMFVDVAHLVRRIAKEQAKMEVQVRGFLVLPDAFGAIPASNVVRRGMNARAFAAMRENKRFTINFDWDLGYPMYYKAPSRGSEDPVLQSSIRGQLFDHVYYIDGHRPNFPLYAIPLEKGVAPTVADVITAMLDEKSAGKYTEHERNLQQIASTREGGTKVPYYGAIGTYSIVFPIAHITEGFAHRLGLEALTHLLAPAEIDERTKLPIRLASDKNLEAGEGYPGADAARAFLTSSSIIDPTDPTRSVDNTLLLPEIVDIAEHYSPSDESIVSSLASRSLEEWNRLFAPTGQSEDVLLARQKAEAILNVRLIDEVPPGNMVTPKERPEDGQYRIENGVRSFKNVYLGAEHPETGQRSGGQYRKALDEYAAVHLARYQQMLQLKMLEILNGRSANDPLAAKSGKIGHLAEFLDRTIAYLDTAYLVMTKVMELKRSQAYGRTQAVASAQYALEEMKRRAQEGGLFSGRKAYKAQQTYLDMEQNLIDIHKLEIMEQSVADTIKQMRELTNSARDEIVTWIQTLGIGSDSLYHQLMKGWQQVEANRAKDAEVASRLVLGARKKDGDEADEKAYQDFKAYEDKRYQHYTYQVEGDQVAALLNDLHWEVQFGEHRGKPVFQVGLRLTHEKETTDGRFDESSQERNKRIFLTRAKQPFERMKKEESVLGYLMYAYPDTDGAEYLAERIHAHSGPLLAHQATGPIPANFLRVAFGQEGGEATYLRYMMSKLASLSQISDIEKFAQLVNSTDRFTLTLTHTMDLIDLPSIDAYKNATREYLVYKGEKSARTTLRTILHVFPAEVNAVKMEERLPELKQNIRMLHDDVVLQLEKKDFLDLFLFAYAYGLIHRHSFDKDGQSYEYFRLVWDPVDRRDLGEVWLTKPSKDKKASFLEALFTFNYVGRDVGHGEDYYAEINYDAVRRTLERQQWEDMLERREQGVLGESDEALRGWLVGQQPPDDDPVWEWIARHDRLYALEQRMARNLPRMQARLKDKPELQADFDLMSIFVLTLRDELERLKRRIRSRAPREEQHPSPSSRFAPPQEDDEVWW